MHRPQAVAAARALFQAGLTRREIAERLGAHPRAVYALLA
jgi:hypothetical protein